MSRIKISLCQGLLFSVATYFLYKTVVMTVSMFIVSFLLSYFDHQKYEEIERKKALASFHDFLCCLSSQFNYTSNFLNSFKGAYDAYDKIYGENQFSKIIKQAINMASVSGGNNQYLLHIKSKLEVEEVHDFINSTLICLAMGNNMADNIKNTSAIIKEKIELLQNIEVVLTEKKSEQIIVSIMPFLIIAFFSMTAKEYLSMMYTTVAGKLVMTAAGILFLIQRIISKKIIRIEI